MIIELSGISNINIGRNPSNDIVLDNKSVSGFHCTVFKKYDAWYVTDLHSTNGTWLDEMRIDGTKQLIDGNVLRLIGYEIIKNGDVLEIIGDPETIKCNINPEQKIDNSNDTSTYAENTDIPHRRSDEPYPYFTRSPRMIERASTDEIEIEAAPDAMAKPEINWITIIISSLGSVLLMSLIPIILTKLNIGNGYGSMMAVFMVPMAIMGLLTATLNYNSQKKKFKKEQYKLEEVYSDYIEKKASELKSATDEQRRIAVMNDPNKEAELDAVEKRGSTLWNRSMNEDDALGIRAGLYSEPFAREIKVPKLSLTLHEKQYRNDPQSLKDKYVKIDNVPFCISLRKFPQIGITGSYDQAASLIRSMILNMTYHYGYDDVRMIVVFDEQKSSDWDWVRWLPHVKTESDSRLIVCSPYNADEILKPVEEELRMRGSSENSSLSLGAASIPTPVYVFVLISPDLLSGKQIVEYILSRNPSIGVGTIIYKRNVHDLPNSIPAVIEADGKKSRFYETERANDVIEFVQDDADISFCDTYARSMAPIRLTGGTDKSTFPSYVPFMEGYGINKPEDLDLDDYWSNARPEQTMSVPIGVKSNGETFYFDIHEKDPIKNPNAHGPHGMVAGMTGSGKTEMIQSWILSMSIQFSPREISFVLIDFKGTGLIQPFINLPHLAGSISDLDTDVSRNLIALQAEIKRRETILSEFGCEKISTYMDAYRHGKVKEPLSYLFIIIDEYAEFKKQFPDFTAVVDSLYQRGRSLGIHIIVMAQNPTGIITGQTESNINFRWCLRVAKEAVSKEVIPKHPEAAYLSNPGRAYIQVGADEVFALVQSFYCGAAYIPNVKKRIKHTDPTIYEVDLVGNRKAINRSSSDKNGLRHGTEISTIVSYIAAHAKKQGIPNARQIWSQKMPAEILLDDISDCFGKYNKEGELAPLIGMLDDPATQKQHPFYLPLSEDGHTVIYGAPGTGKTTFLQTVIYSICKTYTAEEVNMYLLDFGGWSFGMFNDYPHVGGVCFDNDESKLIKITELIEKLLEQRKKMFSASGVGSLQAYNRIAENRLQYIVLFIDNFVPVLQLYPQLDSFFAKLTREGGGYGIYLVTCVNSVNGLGYRLQQNIRTNIVLQMNDKADYAAVIGRTDGLYPEKHVGRGLYRSGNIMEFQTAVPGGSLDDSERSLAIRNEGIRQHEEWKGAKAAGIPVIPDIIYPDDDTSVKRTMLGICTDSMEKMYIDFESSHLLLISGTPGSGKTNMLRSFAMQLGKRETDIRIFGTAKDYNDLSVPPNNIYESGSSFDTYIETLSEELKHRKEIIDSKREISDPTIILLIDDMNRCYREISDLSANRLNAAARLGGGLKFVLVIAGDMDEFNRYKGMIPVIDYMASDRLVILGGRPSDHLISNYEISFDMRNNSFNEHEGLLIDINADISNRFKAVYGGA